MVAAMLHYSGCKGFVAFCDSYRAFRRDNLPLAFLLASQSLWAYQEGVEAMEQAGQKGDEWITHAFLLGIVLILFLLMGAVVAMLSYRFAARRLFGSPPER